MNRAFRNLVLLLIVALTSVHINFSYTQSVQKGAYAVSSSLKSDADYVISAFGLATDFSPERCKRLHSSAGLCNCK